MPSASELFLEALNEAGIECVFANWGSDHPGIVEAIAAARAAGRPVPRILTCPNEMVALSAAHGHWLASGRPQCVIVHVECGTQALAGAVHNAAKGRAPVLIVAGASPVTQEGERPGSRNEFIQWIQDVHDQRGIVRGYTRYDAEIRSGTNIKQMVHRALQIAGSDPKGPAYLMAAREILEEDVPRVAIDVERWKPLGPAALGPEAVRRIVADLAGARRPLVVTSYLGRRPDGLPALVRLCDRLGIGVLESVPNATNFPADNPLHLGNQWNQPRQNEALAEADAILVIESDVPWIPTVSRPSAGAVIHHVDVDPLKEAMPLWYIGATTSHRADPVLALAQLAEEAERIAPDAGLLAERRAHWTARHRARRAALDRLEEESGREDAITGEFLTAAIRRHLDDATIVASEGISHYHTIGDHLALSRPGSLHTSGGGSLGWNGGAALGMKLARPDATVVALCGDGSYLFSVPSSVHWMARRYDLPFLQVVYNNRGWKSPKLSTLAVHPAGDAARANAIDVDFDEPPDHAGIAAAAGGAFARTVRRPEDLEEALEAAFHAVRVERRAAVLDVWVPHL